MAKGSFEKQMKRLEEIVSLLEQDETDLETSISLYEEGLKLSAQLQKQLNGFEEKIESLKQSTKEDDDNDL